MCVCVCVCVCVSMMSCMRECVPVSGVVVSLLAICICCRKSYNQLWAH